jgi:lipopolysaccharide/colanic/teichoic acid biosynthesis glycosyltransferase
LRVDQSTSTGFPMSKSEERMDEQSRRERNLEATLKRATDIGISSLLLLLLLPLFPLIMCWIKLDSKGSVFYRGLRVGRFGRPFKVLKFRTMVHGADRLGGVCTADDDPRITKAGRFLREYKLDELPQFFNVLKGDMSLVGPRPEVQKYVEMFSAEERAILRLRPGITDRASLWDSDEGAVLTGTPDAEAAYLERIRPHKVHLQLEYARNHSLRGDLTILLQTAKLVASRLLRARRKASPEGPKQPNEI